MLLYIRVGVRLEYFGIVTPDELDKRWWQLAPLDDHGARDQWPHSSLGGLTPEEFARRAAALQAPPAPSDPQPGTINHAVGLAL